MTEYFRITGLNTIPFDSEVTGHADHRYRLVRGESPKGIDEPLTKEQAIPHLRNLPTEIASHILGRPGEHVMSIITFPFSIQGADDADMENAERALRQTLEDGKLYIRTKGARGTRAVLRVKADELPDDAGHDSYKTVFWGEFTEDAGREILGAAIKESYIRSLQMRLYCEAYWRPEEAVTLGPNEIMCPSFEEDGNADGEADNWDARGASVLSMESTIVLHGCYSQQVDTDAANEGIESTAFAKDAAETDAVAYAWICRPAAGSDIRVIMRDTTNNVDRDTALLSTGGWDEADAKDGINTFYRLEVSSDSLPAGAANYELWIESTTDTETTFYVDKCFWLWGTTTAPDEWCDHWRVYNHRDTDESHQNYFDLDDLKGDIQAPIQLLTNWIVKADEDDATMLRIARRTRGVPSCLNHWWEAEDFSTQSNWADSPAGDATCSNGDKVIDSANAAGHIIDWIQPATESDRGRFRIYARLKTNDIINTRLQLSWGFGGVRYFQNSWTHLAVADKWQLVYMGDVYFDPIIRYGIELFATYIRLDYEKDAADTVECDYLWLLPSDEPALELDVIDSQSFINTDEYIALCDVEDFNYHGHEYIPVLTIYFWDPLVKRGMVEVLPYIENRLYFYLETYDGADRVCEVHGATTDLQMEIVNISYLPQFISPLE